MSTPPLPVLDEIQQRLLWLSARMIDEANQQPGEVKVGGHQASSASMLSIMTALWFGHLGPDDKVAVKPHASPAYHAIKYLTGEIDREWLTTLRKRGGLQAYPSRTKDPDVSDFSTGSVGLGAVAPLFSAAVRRMVDQRFGPTKPARFIALVGDAELDEGNVWEAVLDPSLAGLGNVMLVIDLNRQSLDRVVPDKQAGRLAGFFEAAGWHVTEAKYGSKLLTAFLEEGGQELQAHIDHVPNEAYQQLLGLDGERFRSKFLESASEEVHAVCDRYTNAELKDLVTDLGGHDLEVLLERFKECDAATDRPSVIFAYTIKGHGLPLAGDVMNHSMLMTAQQIADLRTGVGLDETTEWDRFDPRSAAGALCSDVGQRLNNTAPPTRPTLGVPDQTTTSIPVTKSSTQENFGRVLARLADVEGVGDRIVTAAPDVSITTNLGGWINKRGVYSHEVAPDHGGADGLLRWTPTPEGQHIELGISEMNLFMLLGQLGLSHEHHGQQLLPIGVVYDPFVLRGLDAFIYGLYNASKFIVVGTPSGVSLAPEGGAHQSTITPSVGIELPNLGYVEPCFGMEVDWLLCDALQRVSAPDGESTYLRLSTRPIDQQPFDTAAERIGTETLRSQVVAGGYRLREGLDDGRPGVTIVATGAVVPEALAAAEMLDREGVEATVITLTSPDRVYKSWQSRHRHAVQTARSVRRPSHLHTLVLPNERGRPIVSVQDASSHSLAWLGSALGTTQIALGVDQFGESGSISDLYEATGISAGNVVNAALLALFETNEPG